MTSDRSADHFNHWLDDLVTGMSTPVPEPTANESLDLEKATSAARQFHSLSGPLSNPSVSDDASESLDSSWKDVLVTHQVTHTNAIAAPLPLRDRQSTTGRLRKLNRILSIAATIALFIGILGTAWLYRDRIGIDRDSGGDGDDPSMLAAVTLPNGQGIQFEFAVPTEEDCTVEPLTVDQVMEKLTNYYDASQGVAYGAAFKSGATPEPQSPVTFTVEEARGQVVIAQQEFVACSIYGTEFQRWALMTNGMVQQDIADEYMPAINMEVIRADLEQEVKANTESSSKFAGDIEDAYLPMVVTYQGNFISPENTNTNFRIEVIWVRADGSRLTENANDPEIFAQTTMMERNLPNTWQFVYDRETQRWLLNDMSVGHG